MHDRKWIRENLKHILTAGDGRFQSVECQWGAVFVFELSQELEKAMENDTVDCLAVFEEMEKISREICSRKKDCIYKNCFSDSTL